MQRTMELCSIIQQLRQKTKIKLKQSISYVEIFPNSGEVVGKTKRLYEKKSLLDWNGFSMGKEKFIYGLDLRVLNINVLNTPKSVECRTKNLKYYPNAYYYPVVRLLAPFVLKECNLKGLVIGDLAVFSVESFGDTESIPPNFTKLENKDCSIGINTSLTTNLVNEGNAREFIRFIQNERKNAKLVVGQKIEINFSPSFGEFDVDVLEDLCSIKNDSLPLDKELKLNNNIYKYSFKLTKE